MPRTVLSRRAQILLACTGVLMLPPSCDRSTDEAASDDAGAAASAASSASGSGAASGRARRPSRETFPPARDACELIPPDELATLIGGPVQARREVLERPDESVCAYAPPGGWSVLYVTVYWRGGRRRWEERESVRMSGEALAGIGDAAHYGGLLPSLVLNGDVLLEFAMPLLPDEKANFPVLARSAVSRL